MSSTAVKKSGSVSYPNHLSFSERASELVQKSEIYSGSKKHGNCPNCQKGASSLVGLAGFITVLKSRPTPLSAPDYP